MTYDITHLTQYTYQHPVSFCHNRATLKPRHLLHQTLRSFALEISPNPSEVIHHTDFFGNQTTHFLIPSQHYQLSVTARSVIEKSTVKPTTSHISLHETLKSLEKPEGDVIDAIQFQLESPYVPLADATFRTYAQPLFENNNTLLESCFALNHKIFKEFEFVSGSTTVSTPITQVLEQKKGVCQDFAHLMIACLRSFGLPTRYVSGYIETIPPEGQEKLYGTDATHAWVSVFIPDAGWVDFDPTNDKIPDEQYVVIGWGRDYGDVAPLKGVMYSSGISQLQVSVDMKKVEPTPINNQF